MFYIFIGFITVDENLDVINASKTAPAMLTSTQNIVGIVMMVIGSIYFCLGMCMVQVVERSRIEILNVRAAYTTVVNEDDTEATV